MVGSTVNPSDEVAIAESTSKMLIARVIVAGLSAGEKIMKKRGVLPPPVETVLLPLRLLGDDAACLGKGAAWHAHEGRFARGG